MSFRTDPVESFPAVWYDIDNRESIIQNITGHTVKPCLRN